MRYVYNVWWPSRAAYTVCKTGAELDAFISNLISNGVIPSTIRIEVEGLS